MQVGRVTSAILIYVNPVRVVYDLYGGENNDYDLLGLTPCISTLKMEAVNCSEPLVTT
jgi:hypothetical protein